MNNYKVDKRKPGTGTTKEFWELSSESAERISEALLISIIPRGFSSCQKGRKEAVWHQKGDVRDVIKVPRGFSGNIESCHLGQTISFSTSADLFVWLGLS